MLESLLKAIFLIKNSETNFIGINFAFKEMMKILMFVNVLQKH